MENALKRIEVGENIAAMTLKLSKEIIYINESLFSELIQIERHSQEVGGGTSQGGSRRARFVAGYFRFKRGDLRKSGKSGERR